MANDATSDVDRAWDPMKKIADAMLVRRDGEKLRARPMTADVVGDDNVYDRKVAL